MGSGTSSRAKTPFHVYKRESIAELKKESQSLPRLVHIAGRCTLKAETIASSFRPDEPSTVVATKLAILAPDALLTHKNFQEAKFLSFIRAASVVPFYLKDDETGETLLIDLRSNSMGLGGDEQLPLCLDYLEKDKEGAAHGERVTCWLDTSTQNLAIRNALGADDQSTLPNNPPLSRLADAMLRANLLPCGKAFANATSAGVGSPLAGASANLSPRKPLCKGKERCLRLGEACAVLGQLTRRSDGSLAVILPTTDGVSNDDDAPGASAKKATTKTAAISNMPSKVPSLKGMATMRPVSPVLAGANPPEVKYIGFV